MDIANIIVGLGNNGIQYQNTRHNIGFKFVDFMINNWSRFFKFQDIPSDYDSFIKNLSNFDNDLTYLKSNFFNQCFYIIKPLMMMNNSGIAIKKFIKYYGINYKHIIIIHDDIDINFGNIRLSFNSGHGGHNGVESIINCLNTKRFIRFRIGIGRNSNVIDYVMDNFNKFETNLLDSIFVKIIKTIKIFFEKDLFCAMNFINTKNR